MISRITQKVWTDGACIGNPGPGGWAYKFEGEQPVSGYYPDTTNNNMEMMAVFHAVEECPPHCNLTVYTDSKLVAGWLSGKFRCKMPHIQNIRKSINEVCLIKSILLQFEFTKGHAADIHNNMVDRAANAQARKLANIEMARMR